MSDTDIPSIDLAELSIDIKDALCLTLSHPISPDILSQAQSRYLDHLIVIDASGLPAGFLPTHALKDAFANPAPWQACAPHLFQHSLPRHTRLDVLLESFQTRPIAAVLPDADTKHTRFVTFSDLNKHPVRSAMYPLFAQLEAHLAIWIDRRHKDPWEWIAQLDRDKQARIVGYWELSRRDGVDIGPIAGATLHELFTIIKKDASLRAALGVPQGNKWDSLAHGINELRNLVMHPVRPIFAGPPDLARTRQRILDLAQLVGVSSRLALSEG